MINVFTVTITPRLQYVLGEIFTRRLGLDFEIITDVEVFTKTKGVRINYSNITIDSTLQILPHGLLNNHSIEKIVFDVTANNDWHIVFGKINNSVIPFDIFASIFYLLSRYEEYTISERDIHGRFQAKNSVAFANNFLRVPLIELWCEKLKEILQYHKKHLEFKNHTYTALHTVDVDLCYKYFGIDWWKWIGKLLIHTVTFNFEQLRTALLARYDPMYDPYNTYEFILSKTKNKAAFFMLMNNGGKYDRTINPNNLTMKNLVLYLKKNSAFVGIHPSYVSNTSTKKLKREIDILANILNEPITQSRQHYLKLQLPETYKTLLSHGIKTDYSLFYAEEFGFRASTCFPFYFYNLKEEKITDFEIMPTCFMDTTAYMYYNSNSNWLNELLEMKQKIKQYKGNFITLWHNNNLENNSQKENFITVTKN